MKKLIAIKIIAALLLFNGCASVKAWEITHRPQLEQSLFLVGHDVGTLAVKMFIGGLSNGKFSLAAALQSIEGNYVSAQQIVDVANVWNLPPSATQAAGLIAADLANHPPKTQAEALARLEGYVSGLQGEPLPAGVVK